MASSKIAGVRYQVLGAREYKVRSPRSEADGIGEWDIKPGGRLSGSVFRPTPDAQHLTPAFQTPAFL
jgi:hypothetical protein